MHQRLDCYRILVDVAKEMPAVMAKVPRGEGYLMDQLKRALVSSILNLAEGNGRYSTRERNRFFDISLASIKETISSFEIMLAFRLIDKALLEQIISQLEKAFYMIRKLKK